MQTTRIFPLLFLAAFLSLAEGCKTTNGTAANPEAVALQALRGIQDTVDIATRAWADYATVRQLSAEKRQPINDMHDAYRSSMLSAHQIIDTYRAARAQGTATDTSALETAIKLVQAASNEILFRIAKEME